MILTMEKKQIQQCDIHFLEGQPFKTNIIAILLRIPLTRQNTTKTALLAEVLKNGCQQYPSRKAVNEKMDDMMGSVFDISILKKGQEQILFFYLEMVKGELLKKGFEFLQNMIFSPLEERKGFPKNMVEREKKILAEKIKGRQDDKKEYAKLLSKKQDMLLAHIQQSKKIEADALKKDYDKDTSDLTMSFFTPGSALFKKEEEFRQKLFELDIAYLEKKKLLYAEGSDERAKIEEEIEKKLNDDKLDKQKKLAAAYELFSSLYEESSDEDKKNNELSMMKALLDAKLITQEQYEEAVAKIKERYAEQDIERYRKTKSEHADMVVDMYTSFKKLFDGIAEGKFSFDNLAEAAQSAFAVMSAGLQAYSQYMSAEQDAELAKVEARYDKEIEAAGKNTKKKEKLEKQKEAETAKIKKKYNDRAMKIEIAQAIASTAMGAINAYASAASIPLVGHIIAPIAAALAVAAGMAQVATIRKQHQAEAAGYYSGGFTKRDPNNRREVGVVHANEFVANHEAVANPAVSPVLRLIDHAQRNNTIGSLTAADVSNALGQGSGVSARGAVATPLHKGASGAGESAAAVSEVLTGTRQALDNLNRSIADGIESYMVMDGARGFDRKYNDYNKLKSNPHR